MTPPARLRTVVLDCPEPLALAEFYRSLIGGELLVPRNAHDHDGVPARSSCASRARSPRMSIESISDGNTPAPGIVGWVDDSIGS
jgi:hypothetical protein